MSRNSALVAACLWAAVCCAQEIAEPADSQEAALFQEMPTVEAASLHRQTLREAPANVTIVTADEIRRYGYRTLREVLANTRGFYATNDRIYDYVGVRGFNLPGDYNTRFLVMVNGHGLAEPIYDSANFFGQDLGIDLDLVQRIEIIRGPSSSLYGSNGMLATVNVITKSAVDAGKAQMTTELGSFGEKKTGVSSTAYLGKGANLLISASLFRNGGQSLYFSQYDAPETHFGRAIDSDRERGFHTFASLIWHDWNFTTYVNDRKKTPPIGWGEASLSDPANCVRDSRNAAVLEYSHELEGHRKIRWQFTYDNYLYDERFDYAGDGFIQDARASNRADWLTSEVTYQINVQRLGDFTFGAQASYQLQNRLHSYIVSPHYVDNLYGGHRDRGGAFFAQDELSLSKRWSLNLGLRFDGSHVFQSAWSPRIAAVFQPSSSTAFKLVYGHPFRKPSANEEFYNDGGLAFAASPMLRNETAHTAEFSIERQFSRAVTGTFNTFWYNLDQLIEAVYLDEGVQQYRNNGNRQSYGAEMEITVKSAKGWQAAGSYVLQSARDSSLDKALPNAPQHLAQFLFSAPIARSRSVVSAATRYMSSRYTWSGLPTRSALLTDLTAAVALGKTGAEIQAGIRNLWNWQYDDPVYLAIDRMHQNGRSFFVKLSWRTGE